MKRILTLLAAVSLSLLACCMASAQTDTTSTNDLLVEEPQPKPFKAYCEIVSYEGFLSHKATVNIDFGQASNFWSNDRQLVDENGRGIVFNSILDAVNYMAERGWVFESVYVIQSMSKGDSGTAYRHWVLSKTVTSRDQIAEGLHFKNKKTPE